MKREFCEGKYNPFEVNKIYFDKRSGFIKFIPKGFKKNNTFWLIIFSMYYVIRDFVAALLKPRKASFKDIYNNKILFVLPSVNNQRALERVIDIVKNKKDIVKVVKQGFYSRFYIAFVSIFYLPSLWKEFKKHTKEDKRIALYYLNPLILSPGLVSFYVRILKKYQPECIVLSNDHIYTTKCLELVCEDLGIKTIYVQHASVSYAFPELHFSYSFLDGKDSYIKYTAEGKKCTGEIILLGAARYDTLSEYRIRRTNKNRKCIGIAINMLDDNKKVNDFCNNILSKYPEIKIKIRSHPALKYKPFVFVYIFSISISFHFFFLFSSNFRHPIAA